MIHPYLQFKMEVDAFKRWHFKLQQVHKANFNVDRYLRDMTTQWYWDEYSKVEIHRASTKEKIIFLHALGCSHAAIREALNVSPNTVVNTLKIPPNTRHMEQNDFIDALIEEWEPFKALIPKGIFIKYI